MSRERVVQIIGESITGGVMQAAYAQAVTDEPCPVDITAIAVVASERLSEEGLI